MKCKVYCLELLLVAALMIPGSNAPGDNSAAAATDSAWGCPVVTSTAPWNLHPLPSDEYAQDSSDCTTGPASSVNGFDSALGTASISGGDTFAPVLVLRLTSGWPPISVQAGAIDLSPDLQPK